MIVGIEQKRSLFAYARFYRSIGWNPLATLPSGYPPYGYTDQRDLGQSPAVFASKICHRTNPCSCIQLATGVLHGLGVVDLDGRKAIRKFEEIRNGRQEDPTWMVKTPRGGLHLYYTLPEGLKSLPKRCVWEDESEDHAMIEILGDKWLCRAVPSYKYIDDKVVFYEWVHAHSPNEIKRPTEMPRWIIDLPSISSMKSPGSAPVEPRLLPKQIINGSYEFEDVLAAIPPEDRLALVKSWGLRVIGKYGNDAGWYRCHVIDRIDSSPSASFNPVLGVYSEPGKDYRRFFDIAATVGPYLTPSEACNALGSLYSQKQRSIA